MRELLECCYTSKLRKEDVGPMNFLKPNIMTLKQLAVQCLQLGIDEAQHKCYSKREPGQQVRREIIIPTHTETGHL